MKPLWRILYDRDADVALSGHAHRYERFRPITPNGETDATSGIRQFIIGTGGEPGEKMCGSTEPHIQVMKRNTPGVLELDLSAGSYHRKFVPIAGKSFTDSGTAGCH